MRDALSLLDQAIAHGGGKVGASSVGDMLGTIDQSHLARLLEAVAAGDAAGAVKIADEMQARSLSFDAALADLASLLLRVALAQSVADAGRRCPGTGARAARIDAESVQLYYQIALQGREDLPLAPDEHAGFRDDGAAHACVPAGRRAAQASAGKRKASRRQPKAAGASFKSNGWPELVQQLPVSGAARELARNAELARRDGCEVRAGGAEGQGVPRRAQLRGQAEGRARAASRRDPSS